MLLKIDNQETLLNMSFEDKTKLLCMIDSINLKIESIQNIINNFNDKNAFYDFYCSNIFGKKGSNHLIIKIYGTSFDLYSLKIKHNKLYSNSFVKEKQKNSLFNILFTHFNFELFQKEMIEFEKYYEKLFKKYIIKSFEDNIKKIKDMIFINYDKNIIELNIRSDFESKTFYLYVHVPNLHENNILEKLNYTKNKFPKLINLLNIDFEHLLNQFIEDDADYQEIKFKSDIIFEKIKLIENMNNF